MGHIAHDAGRDDKDVVTVRLKRLDSLLADHPRLSTTRLIKCDVEGYELFVFRGAEQILATARPFVILEHGDYRKHGYSARDVHEFFAARRYSCFAMAGDHTLSAADSMMTKVGAISVNRVMVPEESLATVQKSTLLCSQTAAEFATIP